MKSRELSLCIVFITCFLNFLTAAPTTSTNQQKRKTKWLAIERLQYMPDAVLLPRSECEHARVRNPCFFLGAAHDWTDSDDRKCVCRCPMEKPIFLQTVEKCVDNLADCKKQIRFERIDETENEDEQVLDNYIPLVVLPNSGEVIAPHLRVAWKESAVKVRPGFGPRCNLTNTLYAASIDAVNTSVVWKTGDSTWFQLVWDENDAKIKWNDAPSEGEDSIKLQGAIVRLNLDCAIGLQTTKNAHCIAFRIPGHIINSNFGEENEVPKGFGSAKMSGRKFEIMIILLLSILLFLSLVGSILLWNICWRIEKQKLIRSLQIQFMYLAKQEKEKAMTESQLRYQALVKAAAAASGNQQQSSSILNAAVTNGAIRTGAGGAPQYSSPHLEEDAQRMQQYALRRKLYFSPEFFEPQMLSNPPPLAEQFIHDLRRMISIARERIRIRKHVPKLSAIHELEDEKEETGESSKQSRKDSSLTPVPEMYGYGKVSKEPKKRVKEIQEKAEGSTPLNSVSQQEIPAAEPVSKLDTSSDNCDKSSATHDSKEGEGNENSSLKPKPVNVDLPEGNDKTCGDKKEPESPVKVTNIIQRFESMSPMTTHRSPAIERKDSGVNSRIPIISMKSPRPPPRFRNHSPQQTHQDKNPSLSIDANKTNLEQHLQQPHESPSNENRLDVLDQFKEENVQVDQKSTRITNGSSAIPRMTKRKGYIQNNRYAIYPTDAVKKSLTRRRKIPIDTDTAKK